MWSRVLVLFREYMGTGLVLIWYLLSLLYLWLKEKRRPFRILFLYVPLILLLLFFNPLFAGIVYRALKDEIYYRILWLLPITITIAFAAAELCGCLQGKARYAFAAAAVLLMALSGNFIYSNPFFQAAQNRYHVPDSVVHICDAIQIEGREVTAVFPSELLLYVRQYSGTVCMPYGREITVTRWDYGNNLYDAMEAEVVDAAFLAERARWQGCLYIILPEDKKMTGSLSACQYEIFAKTDGYVIYRDEVAFTP